MKATGKNQRAVPATLPRRRIVKVAIGATMAIALGGGIRWYRNDSRAESLAGGNEKSGDAITRITLDPQAFEGEARVSYRIARANPQLLAKLHCYCRCDVRLGHRNLLDCFRDTHAASCGICMGEAKDADQMTKHGSSVEQIRDAVRARYENEE